jgi:hypothetical protein
MRDSVTCHCKKLLWLSHQCHEQRIIAQLLMLACITTCSREEHARCVRSQQYDQPRPVAGNGPARLRSRCALLSRPRRYLLSDRML